MLSNGCFKYSSKEEKTNVKLDVSQGQKEVAKGEKAMVPINIHLFARAQFEFRIKYAQVIDIDMV